MIGFWNIRGLNSPSKQKYVKWFLHHHNVGLFGLLETKDDVGLENIPNERIDTGHYFITGKEFTNLEEMKKEVEKVGRENNIHIINYTFNAKRGLQIYACDRSGPYRPPKGKTRTYSYKFTGTRKINCSFRPKALRQDTGTWKLFVRCGFHNHELDDNPFGHAKVGKVDQATKEKILNLSKSHVTVGDILTNVGDNELTARQVYNIRQREKAKTRENRTVSEQLLKLLSENGYRHWFQTITVNEGGKRRELTDIIFCAPGSVDMLRQYRYVLVVDNTYNTNMYKMPLLEVVDVTPTHRNFSVFFAFLQNEKEISYNWALKCMREVFNPDEYPEVIISDRELALINAIEKHFPTSKHLLCRRHIEKNGCNRKRLHG
ncbi:PKS-NRPS hybrid synthetase cheA-like [Silene latifolia]|uniref:PKS-NRPS hybrid synthetase cheA-like n=1 Tax=Silene latifolia TaxID=37657 RepID=UPI003D77BE84